MEEAPRSRLTWIIDVLGIDVILLPCLALGAFLFILVLLLRGKGPAMVGAILLLVPMPICWGVFSTTKAIVFASATIALSEVELKQSEVWGGLAESLLGLLVAILLSVPSFLLALVGLTIRALKSESSTFDKSSVSHR